MREAGVEVGPHPRDEGPGDEELVGRLRAGDDGAYARLVREWSPLLLRTAMAITGDRRSAERVVREAWLDVPREVQSYRPPPGLRSWVCGLLLRRWTQEATPDPRTPSTPTVDPSRFLPPTDPQWPGHWQTPPTVWPAMEDGRPATTGVGAALRAALDALPPAQRAVVGLRDVAGCDIVDITEIVRQPPEQVRRLLHHGRAELRRSLEDHFDAAKPA